MFPACACNCVTANSHHDQLSLTFIRGFTICEKLFNVSNDVFRLVQIDNNVLAKMLDSFQRELCSV
jgi:hypothetical protein